MTILAGNIKLVASQVMADVPNGGGAPTSTIILDAATNAIFPDISELDRAVGRVNMRKVHVHVQTPNVDAYLGANVIVADPPDDPNVSVTIFSNGSVFDQRSDAASRVESYLNAGPEWPGYLYENHIEGQRSMQLYTRANVAPPPVGRTLLLRMNEGTGTEYEQYVRITRVASEQRTFTDANGDWFALIVTCDLSDSLRADFPGSPASRYFTKTSGKTLTRDTVVADAGSYHGVTPLAVAATLGDVALEVESVYTQLVPNARTETSLVDQLPAGETANVIATTPRQVSVPEAPFSQRVRIGQENRSYNYTTIVSPLPAPGTLRVTFRALGNNYSITDNGDGTMSGSGSGTVNYLTGSIAVTLQALPDDRSAVVSYWGQNTAYTNRSGQAGYRAPEFSFALAHRGIAPGTLVIEWLSGAVLKTATADLRGVITGHASGAVNYNTGLVFLKPSAMLDAGGEFNIEYDWSEPIEEAFPGLSPDGTGSVQFTLANEPIPGTVEVSWVTTRTNSSTSGVTTAGGSATKTATAASGTTSAKETNLVWTPNYVAQPPLPPVNSNGSYITPPYGEDALVSGQGATYINFPVPSMVTTETSASSGTSVTSSRGATYSTSSQQTSKTSVTTAHVVTDDGDGNLFGVLGSVGYVSKVVIAKVQLDATETSFASNHEDASNWEALNDTTESTATTNNGGTTATTSSGGGGSATAKGGSHKSLAVTDVFGAATLKCRYKTGAPSPLSATETYSPPSVSIDLCPYTSDVIVPGSVQFVWMGQTYQDFEGRIYRGRTTNDPGIDSGVISYVSGLASMSDYVVSGSPSSFTLQSLWTRKPRGHVANVTFAAPLAPLVPGGLTLSVLDVSGTQIIATANTAGEITGTHTRGVIDFESGLVEVQFGDYVLDTGLTAAQKAEWWYDAGNIRTADGKIWKPWPVDPETLRYNCVAYFYLPLDADILGLDPVRLPQDGRVPIFRPGGLVVVGHTGALGPQTVSNGQTLNCARVRLSRVRVVGDDGQLIDTGYTADLEAGTVTFSSVTGYSQPVTVEHRIEDMAMVAEAQIGGQLRLTRQLTHDYPVPGSYVSSALVIGDMQTYVSVQFDQVTWTGVWSDAQIGSAATGTFNDILAPIEVSNVGTVTERWYCVFTNTTAFSVVGEHVGVIATGNTSTDCAPLNPATGAPYFTLRATGWGLGWSTGNVMRFNTIGTIYPVWTVRTIQQGPETVLTDEFTLLIRGDVDRP